MMSEPGNHHQFLKLEKNMLKKKNKWWEKRFTSPTKATAFGVSSRQHFWARRPNRSKLSNHTRSSLQSQELFLSCYVFAL